MKSIFRFIFLICIFMSGFSVWAQIKNQETDPVHSEDQKNHFGLGYAGTHILGSEGVESGFHVHYLHQLGKSEHWSMGAGYEAILGEHYHNSVNLLFDYRPVHSISLSVGPGLVFGKHEGEFELMPSLHTEAVLEFEIHEIHFGPLIGFGIDKEDKHFSLGLHLGFGF